MTSVVARGFAVAAIVAACHPSPGLHGDAAQGSSASDALADVAGDVPYDAPDVDAPMIDAACIGCGPIAVTLYGDGVLGNLAQPLAGVAVYFIWPDQTAIKVISGADGIASSIAPDGTEILIARHVSQQQWSLTAYQGLLIGDSIVDGPTTPLGPDTVVSTEYFTYPTFHDATTYYVRASCGSGTQGTTSPLWMYAVQCAQYNAASAVVYATDSMGRLGYASLQNLDYAAKQGSGSPIAFSTLQSAGTTTANFTNLPAGNNYLEVWTRNRMGSDPTQFGYADLYGGGSGSSASVSGPIVPFGDRTELDAQLTRGVSGYGQLYYKIELSQLTATIAVDAATMIHPLSAYQYDSASNTISWNEEPGVGTDATTVFTGARWTSFSGLQVGLSVRGPRAGTSFTIPALPADLSQLAGNPNQRLTGGVRLEADLGKTYHDSLVGQTGGAAHWIAYTP